MVNLERGDIIKISFDPSIGHEQSGYRPALIISNKAFHQVTGFAFCLPITSKQKNLLFEVEIVGKKIKGIALPHCVKMMDLRNRDFVFVEKGPKESVKKAQIILSKIIQD